LEAFALSNVPDAKVAAVDEILRDHASLKALVSALLEEWPEHEAFLAGSLGAHDAESLATVEEAAALAIRLMGDDIAMYCQDYRWMCGVFNDEALHFVRTGEYRCQTFAEAEATVYSDKTFMKRYMNGALISQPLWFNHARSFVAYRRRFLPALGPACDYLEVGPGHGLYLGLAASEPTIATVTAWDVSGESVRQTKEALAKLGVTRPVSIVERSVMEFGSDDRFDAIVISEVLEHLEEPSRALESLVRHLRPGGRIFISVPINSPAPDHIFLLKSVEEAAALVNSAGLRIVDQSAEPMSGYTLKRALARKATVTCLFVAEPRI
jgi:2-polyprenyl-3-methyl-5-hydroxy-6-metoxy-1,4-benzoquinol methylase